MKDFLNYLISGSVPSQIKHFIAGARLIALEKPNKDVRPIAIGESFRRISSKVICRACQSDVQEYFSNIQYGNQKRGTETIIHRINAALESLKNWCILKVDIANAFNSVKRKSFLDQLATVFPKAYNWSKWLYEEKTPLLFSNFIIWSETGVQQGDPLGPLLFCAAIHPILEKINRECNLDINAWYMDDGNLLCSPEKLFKALEILSTELPKIGLHLNPSKSEWITSSDIKGPEGVPITPKDQLIILGVPLGSKEFCLSYLDGIIHSNSTIAEKLLNLDDSQISMWLFRFGISFASIVHLLRTIPAVKIQTGLERYDYYVAYYFEKIIGSCLNKNAKTQFRLPIRNGGFGFRSVVLHSEAAYKASHGIFLNPEFSQTQKMFSEILDNKL